MEFAKGMATGFIVGVAAIGVAVALLYNQDDAAHERNAARIDKLEAHVERLEQAVTRLSGRVAESMPSNAPAMATPTSLTSVGATAGNPRQRL